MVGARTFADVLDRHLRVDPIVPPSTYSRSPGIATPSIWPAGAAPGWTRLTAPHGYFASDARPIPATHAPVRPSRQLTAEQQAALITLAAAARERLDPSFDHGELKRAFRRAARRLHPDTYPDADGATRRQLEVAFAAARHAYLLLLSLTTN